MKTTYRNQRTIFILGIAIFLIAAEQYSEAGRRFRSANPRRSAPRNYNTGDAYRSPGVGTPGVETPGARTPGVGTPGVGTPGAGRPGTPGVGRPGTPGVGAGAPGRGVAPGLGAPGTPATRQSPRYATTLPADYERRPYGRYNYYYWGGYYYYPYTDDGETIYVEAPVVDGAPTVPPRPYVYALPAGYTIKTFDGVNYYDYLGYYYYVYYINGRAVYTLATVVNGVPTVPPQPY